MGASLMPLAPNPVSADEIHAAVGRILASSDFLVSDRDKRFLEYVVEELIAGRGDRIKAYSIATEVFGRSASFDAQTDPVVRIEAGRVRRALEHYYLTSGRDDEIVTTIPKGGYVPVFARRSEALLPGVAREPNANHADPHGRQVELGEDHSSSIPPAQHSPEVAPGAARVSIPRWAWFAIVGGLGLGALLVLVLFLLSFAILNLRSVSDASSQGAEPDVPKLIVQPFQDLNGTPNSAIISKGLTEEVIGRIAKFKDLVVIAAPQRPSSEQAGSPGRDLARYILAGSVRLEGDRVRLTAKLVSGDDGSVVWANIYDGDLRVRTILDFQNDIANQVATALAQPDGIISRADSVLRSRNPPENWEAYACTLTYYTYRASLDPQARLAVRECLQQAVARFPEYATAWALLSLIYVDELRFRRAPDTAIPTPLDLALVAARHAMKLDPENVRALQAQMMVLAFNNDVEEALEVGERAVAINPNDTELVGEYGVRLATSGQWKRGGEFIAKALDRNPSRLGYFEAALALSLYMQRDYARAATWIRRADVQPNPLYHLIAATIYGQLGDAEAAGQARAWILQNAPDLVPNIRQEFAMRNMQPDDQAHFLDGLMEAGFSIPGG